MNRDKKGRFSKSKKTTQKPDKSNSSEIKTYEIHFEGFDKVKREFCFRFSKEQKIVETGNLRIVAEDQDKAQKLASIIKDIIALDIEKAKDFSIDDVEVSVDIEDKRELVRVEVVGQGIVSKSEEER